MNIYIGVITIILYNSQYKTVLFVQMINYNSIKYNILHYGIITNI